MRHHGTMLGRQAPLQDSHARLAALRQQRSVGWLRSVERRVGPPRQRARGDPAGTAGGCGLLARVVLLGAVVCMYCLTPRCHFWDAGPATPACSCWRMCGRLTWVVCVGAVQDKDAPPEDACLEIDLCRVIGNLLGSRRAASLSLSLARALPQAAAASDRDGTRRL